MFRQDPANLPLTNIQPISYHPVWEIDAHYNHLVLIHFHSCICFGAMQHVDCGIPRNIHSSFGSRWLYIHISLFGDSVIESTFFPHLGHMIGADTVLSCFLNPSFAAVISSFTLILKIHFSLMEKVLFRSALHVDGVAYMLLKSLIKLCIVFIGRFCQE